MSVTLTFTTITFKLTICHSCLLCLDFLRFLFVLCSISAARATFAKALSCREAAPSEIASELLPSSQHFTPLSLISDQCYFITCCNCASEIKFFASFVFLLVYKLFEGLIWHFLHSLEFAIVPRQRRSHRKCSLRKGLLRNFAKFTGKRLCQSLFFNKVAG